MDEVVELIINFSKKAAGLGISAIPLLLVFPVLSASLQGLGKVGGFITGIKGDSLKKKAEDYADYNKNRRQGNALAGQPTIGARRFRRQYRRDLRNQAAEASLKSGQAQFGVTDDAAKDYVQSIAQSNAQVNAINAANNTRFATGVAKGDINVSDGMNAKAAQDAEVSKSIAAQQERAIAEAIKDVELSAEFKPGDVASIAAAMQDAIKKGDSIGARAYQNMLMRSGGPGTKAYREAMQGLGPEYTDSAAMTAVKRNMLANHSGIKETAADLVKHASDQPEYNDDGTLKRPARTMAEISSSAGTWKMSNEELVKQKSHSLQYAETAGGISREQALEIQKDNQLYRRLYKEGQQVIDRIATGKSIAHEEAMVQNALYDMEHRDK